MWVDSHCHLQLEIGEARFSPDSADAQVERARAGGVEWMVCVGTGLDTSQQAIDLASRYDDVYATVGLHPHDATDLDAAWDGLAALAGADRCVAIGEAGFDLHYEHSPRAEQEAAFRQQIQLAKDVDRPLMIHSRDAWDDTFRVLDSEGVPARTIFHCFTGGPDEARAALDRDCYLSFSGIVSFKSAADVRAAAALAPADRVLVETDSPYLAPVPHRGRPNEPAYVSIVGAALAEARGVDAEEIAALTRANAARVFGVEQVTPSQIQALLKQHKLRPSKALGQNFLADTNMAAHIVRLAGIQPGDRVVEVGPGLGSLTLALCDAGAQVLAVELDRRLADVLATVVAGKPVEIVQADAETVDWGDLLAGGERWIMVSNLPYNVATSVVIGALERAPMIDRFLVMVQREVGERLAAVPGTKAYGAVSVKVAYYATAQIVGSVPASVFVPQPKVVSALVRLDRRPEPALRTADPERMFELVRAGFATRRKMLRRVLSSELGAHAEMTLRSAGIDPSARAETLQLSDWAALAHIVATGAPPEVRLDAYAKLTLSLQIVGTRPDGYHEIDAFMVSVSEPHDEIILRPALDPSLLVTGRQGAGVPGDDTNLAARAAYALGAKVNIELHKDIPMGAGLGGGSADAAAVLFGAPRLAGIEVADEELDRIAVALGADVPFCLRGGGSMRVRGIGDDLARVTLPSFSVVIATPPFGCETAAVYRAWDTLGGPVGESVEIEGLPPLRNDLERAAHAVEPRLAAFKVLVEHAAGAPALLAGSGSSYALLFRTDEEAEAARARISDVVEGQIVTGRTVDTGVRLR